MNRQTSLTTGSVFQNLLRFSIPYLLSCFLQTFYGLADLFITGRFNGADMISGVSIGSQLMHMITVMLVGLAMGSTVLIGRNIGSESRKEAQRSIGNSIVLFAGVAVLTTALFLALRLPILHALDTPEEAMGPTGDYTLICFIGIPLIIAYNVISSIFRGLGDTKSPMIFVAVAGVINIILDYILIGPFGMGARGAAVATVAAQGCSVLFALFMLRKIDLGIKLQREDLRPDPAVIRHIVSIGMPIALQDGLIQISFLVITAIANGRGVNVAAAVGIVEKIISFLFLVPSAMLSSVSVLAAQNAGAGQHDRSRKTLRIGILICVIFGSAVWLASQFSARQILTLFAASEPEVITLGGQYLRSYTFDCIFAGVHFCFSGFFSAYEKSIYSFIHNMISVILIRIPGAYLAGVFFPATLYPMGLAAPCGSLLSVLICLGLYRYGRKKELW